MGSGHRRGQESPEEGTEGLWPLTHRQDAHGCMYSLVHRSTRGHSTFKCVRAGVCMSTCVQYVDAYMYSDLCMRVQVHESTCVYGTV